MVRRSPLLLQLIGVACVITAASACSDEENTNSIDPARLSAAPDDVKLICEQACTAADQIRSRSCGMTEFATHAECYAHCVVRYLDYPECSEDFDDANHCIRDEICDAETQCSGAIIMAAACMQVYAR